MGTSRIQKASILLQEERRTGAILVFPVFLILLVFVLYPVLSNVFLSFFNVRMGSPLEFAGTQNYQTVLGNGEFWHSLFITIVYVISTTVLTTVFGIVVAMAMNQSFPLRWLVRSLILFPYVAPIIAVVYALSLIHI